jgi:acetolactate synthase-1/3 small subunit
MHAMLVASTRNTLHALNRIVSLLRGRDFEIVSLTTGRSDIPDVGCLTVVASTARARPQRVASCLEKLEDVWSVEEVQPSEVVRRELALVKVEVSTSADAAVSVLINSGAACVVERSDSIAVLQIASEPESVDETIALLPLSSVVEIVRLGPIAMRRGARRTTSAAQAHTLRRPDPEAG